MLLRTLRFHEIETCETTDELRWFTVSGCPTAGLDFYVAWRKVKRIGGINNKHLRLQYYKKHIPVEFTGRRDKSQNSDKQHLADVQKTPATEREKYERSPKEELREVLTRREAVKLRHESGVEADTQTSPVGKGSNEPSALITKVKESRSKHS